MADKRLMAVVTALLMVWSASGVRAEVTLAQMEEIDRMLSRNDTHALWRYLQLNPQLMIGDDELALELRKFCANAPVGGLSCFYAPLGVPSQLAFQAGSGDEGIY